jgi:hypothetical protein
MITIRIAAILVTATLAAGGDDSQEIRAVLRGFNEAARKPEPQSFRGLFASEADYRDAERSLKGPDALISLFTNRQVWSERTPPILQDESIRLVAPSVAFVDAQFVHYGSTILKSAVPVVLLLKKEADTWKISSWRMLSCGIPLSPL